MHGAPEGREAAVTSFLDSRMRRRHAPSALGVAVIRDGAPSWSTTFGGSSDARFQAGSISKSVTAAVALELVARGELHLDGDVDDRLASWRIGSPTTLRALLGHTGGVCVPYYPGYDPSAAVPTLLESLQGTPPATTVPVSIDSGQRGSFAYSGGAYAIVQQLVEDVTGVAFADAARDLVLNPVGMEGSTFSQPLPVDWRSCAARGDWHVYPEAGAAGLWTTGPTSHDSCVRYRSLEAAKHVEYSPARRPR